MILVMKKLSMGTEFPPHAVIPVRLEQWRRPDHSVYFITYIIDPAVGTIEQKGTNFWNQVATYHIINQP
jgi:hypothetical protein